MDTSPYTGIFTVFTRKNYFLLSNFCPYSHGNYGIITPTYSQLMIALDVQEVKYISNCWYLELNLLKILTMELLLMQLYPSTFNSFTLKAHYFFLPIGIYGI